MRVIVVGAGVMGSASALELAEAGAEVVLLERAVPGAEASSAAAGMLGAQLESHHDPSELSLFLRARGRYVSWAEELRRLSGVDVGHRVTGAMRLAVTEAEVAALRDTVAHHLAGGARAELLDADGARAIEPGLGDGILAAAHYPDESQVEPALLLRALAVAVARHPRVTVRSGATVSRVLTESGRAVGVVLEDSELRADAVVLAAGAWSSLVPSAPGVLPEVRPCRGQLLELEERPPHVRTILAGRGAYIVPRGDGRVVCGSTLEFVGFRREVTAGGIHQILEGALRVLPSLASAELVRTWSSFRPHSSTEKPLVGASPLPGLVLATGHHRNGILLAKVTAEAVKSAVFS